MIEVKEYKSDGKNIDCFCCGSEQVDYTIKFGMNGNGSYIVTVCDKCLNKLYVDIKNLCKVKEE
jgi:hypothetical protein